MYFRLALYTVHLQFFCTTGHGSFSSPFLHTHTPVLQVTEFRSSEKMSLEVAHSHFGDLFNQFSACHVLHLRHTQREQAKIVSDTLIWIRKLILFINY